MGIRILLAEDHGIVRRGLRALIEQQSDMEVVGEAEDGREALRLVMDLSPHVIVMDVNMPGLNGMDATRQITAQIPEARVLALSMHSDKRFVSGMLSAGAYGYLLKNCALEELVRAIHTVCEGQIYLSPRITGLVVEDFVRKVTEDQPSNLLTVREREVLQLLAEGLATKQIAAQMNLSPKTIDTYRQNLMDKLNLRSVAELTKYAIRIGLTSLEH